MIPPALHAVALVHEMALIEISSPDPRTRGMSIAVGRPQWMCSGIVGRVAKVKIIVAASKVDVAMATVIHRRRCWRRAGDGVRDTKSPSVADSGFQRASERHLSRATQFLEDSYGWPRPAAT
jgi:hypothetical protein